MNIQVQSIIFRVMDGTIQYLLLKRKKEKGGFWQPICGRLEEGETQLQGALREIYEETGIIMENILRIIHDVYHFEMDKHYMTDKKIPKIVEYVYGIEINSSIQIDITKNRSDEHEEMRWTDYKTAIEMLKWKDNKTALEKLNKIIMHSKQIPPANHK